MFPQTALTRHSFGSRTAPEIGDLAGRPGSVLVVPVGSVEQHGQHLPVATDTILVCEVLAAALDRVDDVPVLATPPVWSEYSPHHLSFGGTLSGEFDTLRSLLSEVATTGLKKGSTRSRPSTATVGTPLSWRRSSATSVLTTRRSK